MKNLFLAVITTACCLVGTGDADMVVFSLADTSDASFEHDSDGTNAPTSLPSAGIQSVGNGTFSWGNLATDSTPNTASFASGKFTSSDWGGEGRFTSSSIDVSGYDFADISGVFSGFFNTSGESSNFFYTLDGGSEVSFGAGLEGVTYNKQVVGVTDLDISSASNMTVGFRYDHNGSDNSFAVGSLTVSVAAIPEPTAFLFGSLVSGLVGVTVARRRVRRA